MNILKKIVVLALALFVLCGCSEDTSPEYILDHALTEVESAREIETTLTLNQNTYEVRRVNQEIYVDGQSVANPSAAFRLAGMEPLLDGFYEFEKTVTDEGYDIRFLLRESNNALLTDIFQKASTQGVGILKTTAEMSFVSLEIQCTGGSLTIKKGA